MKVSVTISVAVCMALFTTNSISAQEDTTFNFKRIEDNSFLLEEAYNQEPGVIQHISMFQYMHNKTWLYTFTEEWPMPGQKHQGSITLPVMKEGNIGIGDVALNYRYQAIFTNRLAFSPRLSLLLPSGDYKKGLGAGVLGYQVNLPLSYVLTRTIVTHYNLGTTYTPGAKAMDNSKYDLTNINYGASVIVLLSKIFNFMFEVAGNTTFVKADNATTQTSSSLFINPGFRYAINCKSGLQIVPGIAFPIGLDSSRGEYGMFAYLSFEHPLWKE